MTTEEISNNVVGVVLAGGQSRRMNGQEKSLLQLGNKSLLAHTMDRLSPQVGTMVINANGDPDRFGHLGIAVCQDTIEGFVGPLAGVLSGMRWAAQHHPEASHIATVAADTPGFPRDLVAKMKASIRDASITIALATSQGRKHPVFGLWPIGLADELEHFLQTSQTNKVMAFVDNYQLAKVDFPMRDMDGEALDPFFNINTPEDLLLAQKLKIGADGNHDKS